MPDVRPHEPRQRRCRAHRLVGIARCARRDPSDRAFYSGAPDEVEIARRASGSFHRRVARGSVPAGRRAAAGVEQLTAGRRGRRWFRDGARDAGLAFTHFNGMSGDFHLPEIMAPGVGLFDYDNDGDLDVYLVQGQMLGAGQDARDAGCPPAAVRCEGRLFRNDLMQPARTDRRTAALHRRHRRERDRRADGLRHGRGGRRHRQRRLRRPLPDQFGRNQLFRNNGDGTFTDVSKRSRHRRTAAGASSAAFVDSTATAGSTCSSATTCTTDVDADTNCLGARRAGATTARRRSIGPQPSRLYRNDRNGTFADVTTPAALAGGADRPGARRRDGGLQRRRMDRHLRRQRRRAEPALDQPARRHVQEHGARCRRRAERLTASRSQHGRRRRRLRQRRRRGPVHHATDRRRGTTST